MLQAPPLYIRDRVRLKVPVDDMFRRIEVDEKAADPQPDLFADLNGLAYESTATEFSKHVASCANGVHELLLSRGVLR